MKPPLKQGNSNDFQTPPVALLPLLPYLNKDWCIWEGACGKGNLSNHLRSLNFNVIATDINTSGQDFLEWQPLEFDCIITNPPFSLKQQFLERCYSFNKPFALLLPLTTLETAKRQKLFKDRGVEIILFDKRINFETPNQVEKSSSWFATAWFTWGLRIGKELSFTKLKTNL